MKKIMFFLILVVGVYYIFSEDFDDLEGGYKSGIKIGETKNSNLNLSVDDENEDVILIPKTDTEKELEEVEKEAKSKRKNKIRKIEKNNVENLNLNITVQNVYKYSPEYILFKRLFATGTVFLISGSILSSFAISYFLPTLFLEDRVYGDYVNINEIKDEKLRKKYEIELMIYSMYGERPAEKRAYFFGFVITGSLLMLTSVPFYIFSYKAYKDFKKKYIFNLVSQVEGGNLKLAFNVGF